MLSHVKSEDILQRPGDFNNGEVAHFVHCYREKPMAGSLPYIDVKRK